MSFEDILDDYSAEDRARYAAHIAPLTIAELADREGDEGVYYDIRDFLLK